MSDTAISNKLPPIRNRYFFIADVLLMPLAVVAGFCLRLDAAGLQPYVRTMLIYVVLAAVVKPAIFFRFGLYRRYWHYASVNDLVSIALATLSGTVVVAVLMFSLPLLLADFRAPPRSIPFLDWLISFLAASATRFAVRLAADRRRRRPSYNGRSGEDRHGERRVLVMGAGDAGAMIVREMQQNPGLGMQPVCFADDNRVKQGMCIHGVSVLGTREEIPALVEEHRIDQVIIAMPTAPGQAIRAIKAICDRTGVSYKTVPGMYELIGGTVRVNQIRDVQIDDLLRRDPIVPSAERAAYLRESTVMVTGAGGSIGSELCRQVARERPHRLILLDQSESGVYHIEAELQYLYPTLGIHPVIANVRDLERLERVVKDYGPDIVFHAAAYKHVPLMEMNPEEVVLNNVLGTLNLIQVVERQSVARFVLISTDKAVEPCNFMGASKRIAELLVQDAARRTGKCLAAVRFGNVLGSDGSVVPLFERQIAAGGPVTVTHPEMTRFFMTIPEAVQLVIQAAILGSGGEIFVLDMGEPVKIVDMARDLIALSGMDRDIDIEFIGVRPGEKLHEKLFSSDEVIQRTGYEKILVCKNGYNSAQRLQQSEVEGLLAAARLGDLDSMFHFLKSLVPEYCPEAPPLPTFQKVLGDEGQ